MELSFWEGLKTVFYDIWTTHRWRPVVGYEGLYEVDWLCNVRSLNWNRTGETKILTATLKNGYLHVCLCKDGKRKFFYVHRIGLLAWIPNPDNKLCVNHKTHVGTENNVFTQLEWCTQKENIKDAEEFGTFDTKGEKNGMAKFSDATIDKVHELRALGYLHREIGKELSMSRSYVGEILLGKSRNLQQFIS